MASQINKTAITAIGALADRLWEDERWAWSQLKHSDWRVQYFSLVALCEAWDLSNEELFSICKSLLANDPHEKLATNLLGKLGSSFEGTFNSKISAYVASIVNDNCNHNSVRLSAFFALEDVNTAKQSFQSSQETVLDDVGVFIELIEFRMNCLDSKSLEPIDWNFVKQFLARN